MDGYIDGSINGWVDGWIGGGMDRGAFHEGDADQRMGSEEEEKEDEGRGKWEDVSAAIEFDAGHNEDGGGGGPVEGIESSRECVYEIESEDCVIIGGRSTSFEISSCAIDLVDGAQCKRESNSCFLFYSFL